MIHSEEMARVCAGQCPFGYDCQAVDCVDCAKIHADTKKAETEDMC